MDIYGITKVTSLAAPAQTPQIKLIYNGTVIALVQGYQISYDQDVSYLNELGSDKYYILQGSSSGTIAIEKVVTATADVTNIFNGGWTLDTGVVITIKDEKNRRNFTLNNCVIVNVGETIQAGSPTVTSSIQITFDSLVDDGGGGTTGSTTGGTTSSTTSGTTGGTTTEEPYTGGASGTVDNGTGRVYIDGGWIEPGDTGTIDIGPGYSPDGSPPNIKKTPLNVKRTTVLSGTGALVERRMEIIG
jgi:hypothetical protein